MSTDQVRAFLDSVQLTKDSQGNIKLHLSAEAVHKLAVDLLGPDSPEAATWRDNCAKVKEAADRVHAANQAWDDWRDSQVTKKK